MVIVIAVRKVAVMKIAVTKITHCKEIFEDLFKEHFYDYFAECKIGVKSERANSLMNIEQSNKLL